MFKIIKVIKELLIYRDFIKSIRNDMKISPIWTRKNLRVDKINRIYNVINLPPEVILSNDLPVESRPSFVLSEIKPINDHFRSLQLEELMTLWLEPVKGTNNEAYLVVYQFIFRDISWIWVARFLIEIISIVLLVTYWHKIIPIF
jgi:hypothetical protein